MARLFRTLSLGLMLGAAYGPAAFADAAPPDAGTEDIIVFGRAQTREAQALKSSDIVESMPGVSPLKVMSKLPGVNFNSADNFGAYEWSTRLTIRGFNQSQLGFTLDDVPLGDMSYGNHNGLHISRAIASENISSVLLTQGAGVLDTASTSNLGGTLQFFSADPDDRMGATLSQGFGSNAARHTFVKLESGALPTGTKAYFSFTDQNSDKWRGSGEQRHRLYNFKVVQPIGQESRISAFLNYSDRREIDYQDLSLEMIRRLGNNWDNYYPNYQAALASAAGIWHRGETSVDDAYFFGAGLRKDWLGGGTLDAKLTDNVQLKTTVYHHDNKGRGLWVTPYVASPNGVPLSMRTTEYAIDRTGVVSSLTVALGEHTINGGVWYESNGFNQARRFYAASSLTSFGLSPYDFPSNPFSTQWQYQFDTTTRVLHLQDTFPLLDRLTVNVGFKSQSVETTARTLTGADKSGTIKAEDNFLPQVGVTYSLGEQHELFASYKKNMRAFQASATQDVFGTTKAGFDAIKGTIKPEESSTIEAGWRIGRPSFSAFATLYHVDFDNRLLSITQGAGIVGNPVVLANVGRVETYGAEVGATWRPWTSWSLYGSVSYNDSRYRSNYTDNGVLIPVSGKSVVDAPKLMVKTELSYDDGSLFGHFGMNYTSKRYYTYLNDNAADGYALFNLGLGYRLPPISFLREATVQLNVDNLFDKRYIGTVGSNGFVVSDPKGTNQTLLPGAPRAVFVTFTAKL